ncbi:MAG: ribonuclease Z, partial [Verrucomicrobiota bacterium]
MNVTFIGTGEAVDGERNNTSLLINHDTLLDCGYTVPRPLIGDNRLEQLDRLWISHFHGDHFAGTATLMLGLGDAGRKDSFEIIGPPGLEQVIASNLKLHYDADIHALAFPVVFIEVTENSELRMGKQTWTFCATRHKAPCMAIRIDDDASGKSLVYTADTEPFEQLAIFSSDTDLLVHECYLATEDRRG